MEQIQQLATDYGAYLYVLIFLWTFFEGETFVIFAGFAASQDILSFVLVMTAAWLGSFAGDQLYFWVGRRWGTLLLHRIPRWRPGVEMALDWLRRYDVGFILSFRFVYGVRNFASFAMGLSGLSPARFAGLNFAAAFAWALSFAGFGYVFGQALGAVLGDVAEVFGMIMLGFFAVALGLVSFLQRRHRRRPTPVVPPPSA